MSNEDEDQFTTHEEQANKKREGGLDLEIISELDQYMKMPVSYYSGCLSFANQIGVDNAEGALLNTAAIDDLKTIGLRAFIPGFSMVVTCKNVISKSKISKNLVYKLYGYAQFIAGGAGLISGLVNHKRSRNRQSIEDEDIFKELNIKLQENRNELNFKNYLQKQIVERRYENSEVAEKAGIERTYFYKILGGEKIPSRDKVIQIAIGLDMNTNETNYLLSLLGYTIYANTKRDIIISFCIDKSLNIYQTDECLQKHGVQALLKAC